MMMMFFMGVISTFGFSSTIGLLYAARLFSTEDNLPLADEIEVSIPQENNTVDRALVKHTAVCS